MTKIQIELKISELFVILISDNQYDLKFKLEDLKNTSDCVGLTMSSQRPTLLWQQDLLENL